MLIYVVVLLVIGLWFTMAIGDVFGLGGKI